jgi:hypothetical protein
MLVTLRSTFCATCSVSVGGEALTFFEKGSCWQEHLAQRMPALTFSFRLRGLFDGVAAYPSCQSARTLLPRISSGSSNLNRLKLEKKRAWR